MRTIILALTLFIIQFGYAQTQEATLYFKDGTSWEGLAEIRNSDMGLFQ